MDVYQRRRLVALSAIAVVFILFVLLIKSCGGSDETPVTPVAGATGLGGATVLAQSDYIGEADAICLEANTSLAGVDEADPVQAASDRADIIAGELQQLQTLPRPDDGTDKLDKFLSALDKQSAAYQDQATALDHGDDAAAADISTTIDEATTDASDASDAFGFKVCGDPSKVGEPATGGSTDSSSTTDTGGSTVTPTEPVTPATTTTPVTPVTPAPTDGGGATPTPPATDGGSSDSGGVSP